MHVALQVLAIVGEEVVIAQIEGNREMLAKVLVGEELPVLLHHKAFEHFPLSFHAEGAGRQILETFFGDSDKAIDRWNFRNDFQWIFVLPRNPSEYP